MATPPAKKAAASKRTTPKKEVPTIKSFTRAKKRKDKDGGVKFMIDDVEFETVFQSIPLGLALEFSGIAAASDSERSALALSFFKTVLGPQQFPIFLSVLNDENYDTSADLLGDLTGFILGEMSARFSD